MINLFKVFMSTKVPEAIRCVLLSGYVGDGNVVKDFENELVRFIGNPHVLAVNSGTSAIKIALRCAGVERDDIVISTPMTCLATNMAILDLGAQIVWSDVDSKTGLMARKNVEDAFKRCSTPPRAVLCMHWGGLPCEVDEFQSLGIPVIEDACQALGSRYKNAMIGNHSFASCFSFQAIKTLTTGDGGAIAFKHESSLERARLMKWFGLDRRKSAAMRCEQDPREFGYKAQMNDIAAAIGVCNIKYLRSNMYKMDQNVDEYREVLSEHRSIDLVDPIEEGSSCNWLCTVLVDDSGAFIAYMRNKGIECSKVHSRNDTKRIFKDSFVELKGIEEFNRRHVCIPCGWWLSGCDVEIIKKALKGYKNGYN